MSDTIQIEVTAKDIANGKTCQPSGCPVALGLRRASGESSVTVGCTVLSVRDKDGFRRYEIPTEIEAKIIAFDLGHKMDPFTFTARQLKPEEFARVANKKSPHPDYARH